MSHFPGLSPDIVGIVLVGAEGCAETQGEPWLREATPDERTLFIDYCRELIRQTKGAKAADNFDFSDVCVDGTGRPYWLVAVLDHAETPQLTREKAQKYTRCLRVHCD